MPRLRRDLASTKSGYKQTTLYKNLNRKISKLKEEEELHHRDVTRPDGTIPAVVSMSGLLSTIPVGDSEINRTGNEITLTSLKLRGHFYKPVGTTTGVVSVRMLIVYSKGLTLAQTSLLSSTSGSDLPILDDSVITNAIYAPYWYSEVNNYKILFDELFVFKPRNFYDGASDISMAEDKQLLLNIPLDRKPTVYLGSGTAAPAQGDLAIFLVTNNNNSISCFLGGRIYFHP